MSLKDLIAAAFNKDASSFESAFSAVMQEKVSAGIQSRFAPAVYEEEVDLEEAEGNVSSGPAQHALSSRKEMRDHADYMKKKHGVTTKFHRDDELSYHGPKNNVKKAIMNHYDGDKEFAREEHPHLFESVEHVEQIDELSKDTLGSYVKKASRDIGHIQRDISDKEPGYKSLYQKRKNREAGVSNAVDKLTKEDVDQIDEISKGTLGRYINKASANKGMHDRTVGRTSDKDSKEKSNRRAGGITVAAGKLSGAPYVNVPAGEK